MKLVGKSDLGASARLSQDKSRVVIRMGPHAYIAARSEAIALATQIVAAVDALEPHHED